MRKASHYYVVDVFGIITIVNTRPNKEEALKLAQTIRHTNALHGLKSAYVYIVAVHEKPASHVLQARCRKARSKVRRFIDNMLTGY